MFKKFMRALGILWQLIGVTIVFLFILEFTCGLFISSKPKPDKRALADGYHGATWTKKYFIEFKKSISLRWEPFSYWRRREFSGEYVQVNTNGIRKTWQATNATVKIFVFGGSTTWGAGARDEYTIPSWIAKTLAKSQINAKITNFGEYAYVSSQEVALLMQQLKKQNVPNIVIFYDGANDTFSAKVNNKAGVAFTEFVRAEEFMIFHDERRDKLQQIALLQKINHLNIKKFFGIRLKSPLKNTLQQDKNVEEQVAETYLGNVQIVHALAKQYKFSALHYWQPMIYHKAKLSAYEQKEAPSDSTKEFFSKVYKAIAKKQKQFAAYNFYDIRDIFHNKEEPVFIDVCHLTEQGNKIIAQRIAKDIKKLLQKN